MTLIIGVVALVMIGMGVYIRRSIQGKVKDMTDYVISDSQSSTQSEDQVEQETVSSFSANSEMTAEESKGGGRYFHGNENTSSNYETGEYKEPAKTN